MPTRPPGGAKLLRSPPAESCVGEHHQRVRHGVVGGIPNSSALASAFFALTSSPVRMCVRPNQKRPCLSVIPIHRAPSDENLLRLGVISFQIVRLADDGVVVVIHLFMIGRLNDLAMRRGGAIV